MYSHNRDGPPPTTTLPSKQSFTLPCLHTRATVDLLTNHRADTGRRRLRSASTRGAAHFWKPVTHDILMRLLITSLSLNFSSCDWVLFCFFLSRSFSPNFGEVFVNTNLSILKVLCLSAVCLTHICNMWLLTAALLFSLLGEYFANYHMDWCNNLCIQQVSVKTRCLPQRTESAGLLPWDGLFS